ncbi:MAG TPA: ATP-binding protein [Polyangiaceae bacterium]|jgi:signal transduction histidine kinase/ActR/RegA family two-component response regulator|nr:ATP-binding protein [Polyangiaceae bacterium]
MDLRAEEIGAELRRRAAAGVGLTGVAASVVDLVYGLADEGSPSCVLVRAYAREGGRLALLAARGEDMGRNGAPGSNRGPSFLPLPPESDGDPVLGLAVRPRDGREALAVFAVDRPTALLPEAALLEARWVFGFVVDVLPDWSLLVVALSRTPNDGALRASLDLVAHHARVALLDADECKERLGDARAAARMSALEALCAAQSAQAAEVAFRAREVVRTANEAARKRVETREAELATQSERSRRAQRAILNVIDDLREARATLEARVEERTRRVVEMLNEREELLRRERQARVEAETARAQAESANRLKDEFLSTVSHELRTPLNAMLGWATMLRGGALSEAKRESALETIERNARTQVRLIEDLLDLGRILQGKFRLALGPVEVPPLVDAALESVRPAAEAKGVRVQCALDSHATILGDGERLQQVAWNLLSNAIKFTPRGGRVLVTLRRAQSYVELVVADTGEGIGSDFLPHIFEPFRQADGAISRRAGGLGLGLSIVRSLVELHGGTVTAMSEGAGQGATFTVRIPTAPVRAEPNAPKIPEGGPPTPTFECPPALGRLRMLVVDDEKDTRELLAFILEQCGAEVTTAATAEEAFGFLQRDRFDVLVSDIGLPGEDGLSLIRRVRALPAERGGLVTALALTAYARTEDRTQALRAGFTAHLAKPVDPSELTLLIAAAVRKPALT